jgi:hypothetical protein
MILSVNNNAKRKYSREEIEVRGIVGRLWMHGRTQELADVSRKGAANLYRIDWDGCRTLWKTAYRSLRERGLSTIWLHS